MVYPSAKIDQASAERQQRHSPKTHNTTVYPSPFPAHQLLPALAIPRGRSRPAGGRRQGPASGLCRHLVTPRGTALTGSGPAMAPAPSAGGLGAFVPATAGETEAGTNNERRVPPRTTPVKRRQRGLSCAPPPSRRPYTLLLPLLLGSVQVRTRPPYLL